jgi:hypothetical protein
VQYVCLRKNSILVHAILKYNNGYNMKVYQRLPKLPNGEFAKDVNAYAEAWSELGAKICNILGPHWHLSQCDPDLRLEERYTREGAFTYDVVDKLELSTQVANRLIALLYKDVNPCISLVNTKTTMME